MQLKFITVSLAMSVVFGAVINDKQIVIRQNDDEVYDDGVANEDEAESIDTNVIEEEISNVENEVKPEIVTVINTDDSNPINRYCKCSSYECNCCRDFSLPLLPIKGPGCAAVQYLEKDKMLLSIKFGDRVLANRVISGRKTTPICLPLPGGYSRFCGRVYGISKREEDFKACLGLELRADNEVEAVLRVSCFKFGPKGLGVTDAEPLPQIPDEEDIDANEEEDDDDDIFGFSGLEDDDDDDDDDEEDEDGDDEDEEIGESESGNNLATGFSLLNDIFGLTTTKKKNQSSLKKQH